MRETTRASGTTTRIIERAGPPPNIAQIEAVMGPVPDRWVITYAPYVYVLSGEQLDPGLLAHEGRHLVQQGDDPAGWWARWLIDIDFRRDQEMECYRAQIAVLKNMVPDRNELMRIKVQIARDISSPQYGRLMEFHEALAALR